MIAHSPPILSDKAVRTRALFLAAVASILALLHFVEPASLGRWLPIRTSCGAVTGLPCLFCGMTRALHLLLRGDVAGALYFNWLAFPFCGAVLGICILFALELILRRRIFSLRVLAPKSGRQLAMCAAAAVMLWALHAWLAVAQHKTELLNPRGPLYSVFVKQP